MIVKCDQQKKSWHYVKYTAPEIIFKLMLLIEIHLMNSRNSRSHELIQSDDFHRTIHEKNQRIQEEKLLEDSQ